MRMRIDLCAAVIVVAIACAICVARAAADGDPASDTLYAQNYYAPASTVRTAGARELRQAIAAAYAKGYRVKVAVIARPVDLGSIPSLFNKPNLYARFLGKEISLYYVGALLVVMPHGLALYDGAGSIAAGRRALAKLKPSGVTADMLVGTAARAVRALTQAGALVWRDVLPPSVFPFTSSGQRGQTAELRYSAFDDSGYVRVAFTIETTDGAPLGRVATGLARIPLHGLSTVAWPVPADAPADLRFCAVASDAAGHQSTQQCGSLHVT
jgi:hypothetical protein